jgi:hypothetical protein
MGGQACGVLSWVSFLLFPHLLVSWVGVAGWNITPEIVYGFGTLLGPEKTSAGWWVVFSGGRSRPGPSNASPWWAPLVSVWVWWWLWWVSGCGGVLSVA